ncbi:MAG TPA: hypothetical protein VF525_08055 [Pyrinomonadaceae bacterium]|jgi:hypothetical protein
MSKRKNSIKRRSDPQVIINEALLSALRPYQPDYQPELEVEVERAQLIGQRLAELCATTTESLTLSSLRAVSRPQPPLNAEFILHLLLRHDEHDALIGDLIERYGKKAARLGVKRANVWFYLEIFWTAASLSKRVVAKVSGLIALGEWVRRHIS